MLSYSCTKISAYCFSDVGDGNLLLLCSKTLHNVYYVEVWRLCWPEKMFDDLLMLLKPSMNLFGRVYGLIIILEYDSIWQQYASYRKNFIIENVETFICSNPVSDVKERTI